MSQQIDWTSNKLGEALSLEEVLKRVRELKLPKQPKLPKNKKLTKAEQKKYKAAAIAHKAERAELKQLQEECAKELELQACNTDFDVNKHPYDYPNDKTSLKDMRNWVNTVYAENLLRRVYGLSDYQLAVVDKTGKIVMTSINTEKVFSALFEARYKEKEDRKAQQEALDKALQEQH